jgi:hypothetical protein
MDKLVKQLGIDSQSKSQICRMATDLDSIVEDFRAQSCFQSAPSLRTLGVEVPPQPPRPNGSDAVRSERRLLATPPFSRGSWVGHGEFCVNGRLGRWPRVGLVVLQL